MIISPLKVWVQNILPVVYDDSLSYLEIVAKINAKTNEIISQTNENTNAIETLAEIISKLGDIDELKALLDEIKTIVEDLYTTDVPLMDGVASAGSADHAARSDHVHPSDTGKANKDLNIDSASANQYVKILSVDENGKPTAFGSGTPSGGTELSDSNPLMDGTASAGSGTKASREDHVHPSDTTKLNANGDGSNVTTAFTVASSRTNIATGEKLSVLFGKIAKWFTDLGTAAFRAATSSITSGSSDLVESGAVFTELNNKVKNNEMAIVITGSLPSMIVSAGQYVIVRNSTISGVTDGMYKAVNALSPGTNVTAADLTASSSGGLNDLVAIEHLPCQAGENVTSSQYFDRTGPFCFPGGYFQITAETQYEATLLVTPKAPPSLKVIAFSLVDGSKTYPAYVGANGAIYCSNVVQPGYYQIISPYSLY